MADHLWILPEGNLDLYTFQRKAIIKALVQQSGVGTADEAAEATAVKDAEEDLVRMVNGNRRDMLQQLLDSARPPPEHTAGPMGGINGSGGVGGVARSQALESHVSAPRAIQYSRTTGGEVMKAIEERRMHGQRPAQLSDRSDTVRATARPLLEPYAQSTATKNAGDDERRYRELVGQDALHKAGHGSPLTAKLVSEMEQLRASIEAKRAAELKSKALAATVKSPPGAVGKSISASCVYFGEGPSGAGHISEVHSAYSAKPNEHGSLVLALEDILQRAEGIPFGMDDGEWNTTNITVYVSSPSSKATVIFRGDNLSYASQTVTSALASVGKHDVYICKSADVDRVKKHLKFLNKAKSSPQKVVPHAVRQKLEKRLDIKGKGIGRPRFVEGPQPCFRCRHNHKTGHTCRNVLHHSLESHPEEEIDEIVCGGWRIGDSCEVKCKEGAASEEFWWEARVQDVTVSSVTVVFLTAGGTVSPDDPLTIPLAEVDDKLQDSSFLQSHVKARTAPLEGSSSQQRMTGEGSRKFAKKGSLSASVYDDDDKDSDDEVEDGAVCYNSRDVQRYMSDVAHVSDRNRKWTSTVMKGLVGENSYVDRTATARDLVAEVSEEDRPVLLLRAPEPGTDLDGNPILQNFGLNVGVIILHKDGQFTEINNLNQNEYVSFNHRHRALVNKGKWPHPRKSRTSGPPPGVVHKGKRAGVIYRETGVLEECRTVLERLLYAVGFDEWVYASNACSTPADTGAKVRTLLLTLDHESLQLVLGTSADPAMFSGYNDFQTLWTFVSLPHTEAWSHAISGCKDTTPSGTARLTRSSGSKRKEQPDCAQDDEAWLDLKNIVATMHDSRRSHKEHFPTIMDLPENRAIDQVIQDLMIAITARDCEKFKTGHTKLIKALKDVAMESYLAKCRAVPLKGVAERWVG